MDCRLLLMMMMFLIERSECDDVDVPDRKIRVWWWRCSWLKDQSVMMMMNWSKDQSMMMMMMLIESSEYDDDDDDDRKFEVWWWCCWSKYQSMMMMMLLIENSKCCWWWCCWSKGRSVDVDVVDRAVKVLLLLKIEDEDYMLKMMKRFQWFIDALT